jgi:hypothetical protein
MTPSHDPTTQTLPPNKTKKGGWKPERKGELARGELVDVNDGEGDYQPYKIYTLAQDDGEEIAVHAFHDGLIAQFAKWRPQWNERLEILYRGRGGDGGANQTDPYLYRMRVEGRDPAPIVYDGPAQPSAPAASDVPAEPVEREPDNTGDDDSLPF